MILVPFFAAPFGMKRGPYPSMSEVEVIERADRTRIAGIKMVLLGDDELRVVGTERIRMQES